MLLVLSPYFCFSSVPVFLAFFVKAFSFFFLFFFFFFYVFRFFFTFFVFSTLKKKNLNKKISFFFVPPFARFFLFFSLHYPTFSGVCGGGGLSTSANCCLFLLFSPDFRTSLLSSFKLGLVRN